MQTMNIGRLAALAQVNIDTIRPIVAALGGETELTGENR
jgi:hypothetical protein